VDLLSILLGLVYLALIALLLYFIYFLKRLLTTTKEIERKICEVSEEVKPALRKLESSLDQISHLTKRIDSEIETIHDSISAFTDTARDYKRIKDKIVSVIEEPVDELQSKSKAFITGIRVFFQTLFRRND